MLSAQAEFLIEVAIFRIRGNFLGITFKLEVSRDRQRATCPQPLHSQPVFG